MIRDFPETGETAVIGQHAHQKPHSAKGPRGLKDDDKPWEQPIDPTGPANYENTILLCGGCHTTVDQAPLAHPVELLAQMKKAHERWVQKRLERKRQNTSKPAPYRVEVQVTEDQRCVRCFAWATIRPEPTFRSFWGDREEPSPRIQGVRPGPPQTVFDVTALNHGDFSIQMKDFKIEVDGVPFEHKRTTVLDKTLEEIFKEPLEARRSQTVAVKANHLARYLRERGVTKPVDLRFTFVDACRISFSASYGPFDPGSYEVIRDSESYEEW
ncbi:MAG: hypothetical protein KIS61_09430 [Candidatus Eremiobacteraeota bacterium]|nr:hypothetical protein [Candidatus Eremiobacteraeota bacterium]